VVLNEHSTWRRLRNGRANTKCKLISSPSDRQFRFDLSRYSVFCSPTMEACDESWILSPFRLQGIFPYSQYVTLILGSLLTPARQRLMQLLLATPGQSSSGLA